MNCDTHTHTHVAYVRARTHSVHHALGPRIATRPRKTACHGQATR